MEACQGKSLLKRNLVRCDANLPQQNLAFAKDEAKFSIKKIQHKVTGGLSGREPDIETETGT